MQRLLSKSNQSNHRHKPLRLLNNIADGSEENENDDNVNDDDGDDDDDDEFYSEMHSPSIDVLGSRSRTASVSSTELTFKPNADDDNDDEKIVCNGTSSAPQSSLKSSFSQARQSSPSSSSSSLSSCAAAAAANDMFAYDELPYATSDNEERSWPTPSIANTSTGSGEANRYFLID